MNRLGKAICVTLVGIALVTSSAEARSKKRKHKQAPASPESVPSPASSPAAKSSMIAGAALAIRSVAMWRNNMPRVLKPGEKDPGSPLVAKAEVEATGGKDAVKFTWKAEVVPAGEAAQELKGLEVNVDGNAWNGELKAGQKAYIEVYSKAQSTLAPGTKAKLVITFTAGAETLKLEEETTVERVD